MCRQKLNLSTLSIMAITKNLRMGYNSCSSDHFTEVHFASFLSGGFATAIVNGQNLCAFPYLSFVLRVLIHHRVAIWLQTMILHCIFGLEIRKNSFNLFKLEGYLLGFPLSRDFSNFQVPGLLDFFSPGTTGPRDLQGL